jgi:hypothetical protein
MIFVRLAVSAIILLVTMTAIATLRAVFAIVSKKESHADIDV